MYYMPKTRKTGINSNLPKQCNPSKTRKSPKTRNPSKTRKTGINSKSHNNPRLSNPSSTRPTPKKLHIIFDLDDTLIHSIPLKEGDTNNLILKKGMKYNYMTTSRSNFIVFFRKYKDLIMNYCLDNFDVSVWSNGHSTYVEKIIKSVFPESVFNKLKVIIGRTKMNTNDVVYKDIKNDITFKLPKYNFASTKVLDYLFEDKFYSKLFNKKNTLLIDDNPVIYSLNSRNTIYVPKLCINDADTDLLKVFMWLNKNKNTKNIQNIDKNIFYDKNKVLCKKEVDKYTKTKKLNIGDYVLFNKFNNKLKDDKEDGYGVVMNKNKDNYDIVIDLVNVSDKESPSIYKNINIKNIMRVSFY